MKKSGFVSTIAHIIITIILLNQNSGTNSPALFQISLPLIPAVSAKRKKRSKKKKTKEAIVYPTSSSHKRPERISAALYCEACKYFIEMPVLGLYGRKREHDIFDVLSRSCAVEGPLLNRPFAPDVMQDACKTFIGHWEPELEAFLMKRQTEDVKVLQTEFCDEVGETEKTESSSVTRACFNVGGDDVPSPGLHQHNQDFRIDMKTGGVTDSEPEEPEDPGWEREDDEDVDYDSDDLDESYDGYEADDRDKYMHEVVYGDAKAEQSKHQDQAYEQPQKGDPANTRSGSAQQIREDL